MSKNVRYYAGKAPEWYHKSDDDESDKEVVHEIKPTVDARISRLESGITQRTRDQDRERTRVANEGAVTERERAKVASEEEEEMLSLEEEEDSSEEESSEEEEIAPAILFKPVFNKSKKPIVPTGPSIKDTSKLQEEWKATSHDMVIEEIKRDLINPQEEIELDVDDTDGLNEEEEMEHWKLRELSRIRRDALEKETREREQREKEENRKKTDKEMEEELKNNIEEKSKIKFLQKYYHKGAFYADDESVSKALKERDFTLPTLGDKVNKELLPSVMQVRNFGKSGRSKYTHLVDQDTTQRDAGWAVKTDVNLKAMEKMGGVKRKFEGSVENVNQKK